MQRLGLSPSAQAEAASVADGTFPVEHGQCYFGKDSSFGFYLLLHPDRTRSGEERKDGLYVVNHQANRLSASLPTWYRITGMDSFPHNAWVQVINIQSQPPRLSEL